MGDLIEFTNSANQRRIFYEITSGAVAFSVRGGGHAAVTLARNPHQDYFYSIVIEQNECWLDQGRHRFLKHKKVPNILSRDAFNKFWISWYSDRLQFGYTSDGVPLISKKIPDYKIECVSFSVHSDRGNLQWKLYLPPKIEKPLLKKVRGGEMHWVEAENQLPDGALIGGFEKEVLYIIRAPYQETLLPGKFVPSQSIGFIAYGGEVFEKNKFEVLCGYNCIWVSTHSNKIPVGSVEGGYEVTHETLYVGRAVEDGHLIPGKVLPSHRACYIPYNEADIGKRDFEILVNPQIAMQGNRYLRHDVEDPNSGIEDTWNDDDISPSSESEED